MTIDIHISMRGEVGSVFYPSFWLKILTNKRQSTIQHFDNKCQFGSGGLRTAHFKTPNSHPKADFFGILHFAFCILIIFVCFYTLGKNYDLNCNVFLLD